MGLPASRFVNLDGSLNESLLSPAQESTKNVLAEFGLTNKDYILLPTGGTPHKNNTVAVQAFALLGQTLSRPLKLVTTSHFRDYEKTELRAIAGEDIIFTDVISDDQLGALFNHARAVLFPSLYEGLGIPVLEAVAHGKPVACSDIDVFREIPHFNEAFYTFDPEDPFGMAEALLQATAEMGFEAKKQHYPDILEKYSWARSAKLFAEALEKPLEKLPSTTKRVAITCPDPRKNADVGKLVQRMYGHGLRRGVEFVYFIDPGGEDEIGIKIMADYIRGVAVCYDVQDLEAQLAAQSFDAIVHFLTDDRRFPALLHAALAHPGYMYVGNDDYLPVITTLRDKHMISSSQADAEKAYSPPHGLSGASFLANAKGIIAEKHVMKHIKAWLTHYKLSVPLLEVPESAVVMSGRDSRSAQDLVFNQIIDFIGVQKHV